MSAKSLTQRISAAAQIAIGWLLLGIATLLSLPGAFGHGLPVAARFGLVIAGALFYAAGAHIYRRGKKAQARSASELLASDPRPPVLYLRAFKDDVAGASVPQPAYAFVFAVTATEEQQIVEVFGELGPVVAIGKPGETLPELGAARLYVSHAEWQQTVGRLMRSARLVIYRASDTQGFAWEVNHGGNILPPEKIVFLIPADSDYERFRSLAFFLFPARFPDKPRSSMRCGSLCGLVYFDSDWNAHYVAPKITWFRNRIRSPLVSVLKVMAEPVFRQLGAPWSPPPIRWGLYAACLAVFVVPICLIVILALLKK